MQRALELSLRDMTTDENATYSTDRGDAMVTSDAGEEDEVRTFVIEDIGGEREGKGVGREV